MALAEELTGHRPEAIHVGIGVADIELGEGLSRAVEASVARVLEFVRRIIEEHETTLPPPGSEV